MMCRPAIAFVVISALCASAGGQGRARASATQIEAARVSRAQTHYAAGATFYRLGNYPEAVREFAAGYELVPKPEFLLDLGQAYRKLGELKLAQSMFEKYLGDTPQSAHKRKEIEAIVKDIEVEIARQHQEAEAKRQLAAQRAGAQEVARVGEVAHSAHDSATQRKHAKTQVIVGVSLLAAGLGLGAGGAVTTSFASKAHDRIVNPAPGATFDPADERARTLNNQLSIGLFVGAGAFVIAGVALTAIGGHGLSKKTAR